jgi:hypothetical protein
MLSIADEGAHLVNQNPKNLLFVIQILAGLASPDSDGSGLDQFGDLGSIGCEPSGPPDGQSSEAHGLHVMSPNGWLLRIQHGFSKL